MAKRILAVTDFTVESLNVLRLALKNTSESNLQVILMYAEAASDAIGDLLFRSPQSRINELTTPEFAAALAILKNHYEHEIQSLRIMVFSGYGTVAFQNFAEGNKIDVIYVPRTYRLRLAKNGFDPIPLIKKSKLPYQEVDWDSNAMKSADKAIDQIFDFDTALN